MSDATILAELIKEQAIRNAAKQTLLANGLIQANADLVELNRRLLEILQQLGAAERLK